MTSFNFLKSRNFLVAQSMSLTAGVMISSLLYAAPSVAQQPSAHLASTASHLSKAKTATAGASKAIDLRGRGTAPTDKGSNASRGCGLGNTRMLVPYIVPETDVSETDVPETETLAVEPDTTPISTEAPNADGSVKTGYQAMLTNTTNPALWMHIPYSPEELEAVEVLIWDVETEAYVYTTDVEVDELGQTPGIVGVNMPSGLLKAGKSYEWIVDVSFRCDVGDGTITTATDHREGLLEIGSWPTTWYSTLSNAAQKRCAGEPVGNWGALLSKIDYGDLVSAPVTACLSPATTLEPETTVEPE